MHKKNLLLFIGGIIKLLTQALILIVDAYRARKLPPTTTLRPTVQGSSLCVCQINFKIVCFLGKQIQFEILTQRKYCA